MTSSRDTKKSRFDWEAAGLPPPSSFLPKLTDFSVPPPLAFGALTTPSEEEEIQSLRERSPYEALMGDPRPLYQDYVARPKMYGEALGILLTDLVAHGREPTQEELRELNRALLIYVQAPKKEQKKQLRLAREEQAAEEETKEAEELEPFGWL